MIGRLGNTLAGGLLALGLLGLPGCTGTSAPPEPVCAAVPEVTWALPTEHRTPLPIPPDQTAIDAAMALKTLVRDRATDPGNPWAISHALLAIGPEAGFNRFEIGLLEAAGCTPVSLGPRTLRVETALVAALGRLGAPAGLA